MDLENASQSHLRKPVDWVFLYTTTVSGLGLLVAVIALLNLPHDRPGLLIFALMVVITELSSVELFRTSRNSSVSVSMIITIAAILALGPFGGVLIEVVNGITSAISMNILRPGEGGANRTSWMRRSAFNMGMFVLSTAAAGEVYLLTGGSVGDLLHLSNILPFVLAVTTDTFVNLGLLMLVICLQTGADPREVWKQDFQWNVPINIAGGMIGGGALALAYLMFGILGAVVFFLPVITIGYSFRVYANNMRGYVNQLEQLNQELRENNIELLETLGAVIDAYDVYTLRHSRYVSKYAGLIAEKMGLEQEECERIVKAALVHDIGKIGISELITSKKGRLTDEEFKIMRTHPVIGANILRQVKGLQDLVPLVQHHQEKFDGSGYPDGLKGHAIPLGARVLTLADSIEAMLTDRPYRSGHTLAEVVAEVQCCSGSHFDPQVVQAFLKLAEEKGSQVFVNSAWEDATQNHPSDRARHFLKRSLAEE